MRRAARRDAVEEAFVKVAEKCGARIVYAGPLDFWLWTSRAGWRPVEVKSPGGNLTWSQMKFTSQCMRDGAPYLIWRTEGDVLAAVEAVG